MHNLITYFPSEQVKPPFRESKVRSATVPGTIGTGNRKVPAGPPPEFALLGGPAFVVDLLVAHPFVIPHVVARASLPRIARPDHSAPVPVVSFTSCGSPLASFLE